MKNRTNLNKLCVLLMCLAMLAVPVSSAAMQPYTIQPDEMRPTQSYEITTQITAGDGWINTVEPSTSIPAGTTKHYRIKPARGYMISDVQIDGESIGPVMFATVPYVNANQTKASDVSTQITDNARILLIGPNDTVSAVRGYLYKHIAARSLVADC